MSNERKFRVVDHGDTSMEVVIGLDPAVITEKIAHAINGFWSSADERLDEAGGDVFVAVAKLAGERAMRLALEQDSDNAEWLQRQFQREEGWPPTGVTIRDVEGLPQISSFNTHCEEIRP